jgi:hypothetical protein
VADDWRAQYEDRKAEEEPQARANLRKALDVVQRLGVRTVYLAYDGEDGAGSIFGMALEPPPPAGLPEGVEEMVRAGAYWLLPPGWEIDAGAEGTLTIDVPTRKARRDHTRRLRSSEDTADELDL